MQATSTMSVRSNVMSLLSKPGIIHLRSLARSVKPLNSLMKAMSKTKSYEDKFKAAVLGAIQIGDTVWDVGANVGFYTSLFLDSVGTTGHVTSFEPSPECFQVLKGKFESIHRETLNLENIALGAQNGEVRFAVGLGGPLSVCSRVLEDREACSASTHVRMRTADAYIESGATVPAVAKIDVEGSELEVLKGMPKLLKSRQLRALFLEIHFNVLQERGHPMAPNEIVDLLSHEGFSLEWIDFSHLRAVR